MSVVVHVGFVVGGLLQFLVSMSTVYVLIERFYAYKRLDWFFTLETSGEDVKTTLGTSEEDVKPTLETSGEDVKTTLETR